MKLENRYFLFKMKELENLELNYPAVADSLRRSLAKLSEIQGISRVQRGVDPDFRAIVVESDWPEYEEVVAMLQKRVDAQEKGSESK
ncbi:hypothetical protein Knedl_CDS0008 [Pseudomonas phage Knedl]|nr:hypothetical protein Knedl_CDS0008 [Pseudomonas phage Knedl]